MERFSGVQVRDALGPRGEATGPALPTPPGRGTALFFNRCLLHPCSRACRNPRIPSEAAVLPSAVCCIPSSSMVEARATASVACRPGLGRLAKAQMPKAGTAGQKLTAEYKPRYCQYQSNYWHIPSNLAVRMMQFRSTYDAPTELTCFSGKASTATAPSVAAHFHPKQATVFASCAGLRSRRRKLFGRSVRKAKIQAFFKKASVTGPRHLHVLIGTAVQHQRTQKQEEGGGEGSRLAWTVLV